MAMQVCWELIKNMKKVVMVKRVTVMTMRLLLMRMMPRLPPRTSWRCA